MNALISNPYLWWLLIIALALALAGWRAPRRIWTPLLGAAVAGLIVFSSAPIWSKVLAAALYLVPALLFNVTPLRRALLSTPLLRFYRASMPEISATERDALEAGTTWWDAELFTGAPHWQQLLAFPPAQLTDEERAFLEGPVERLCAILDDYRINNEDADLPPEAWEFVKRNGFFGMIIPKEYGGKGFSQYGHAAVVMKIATRSISGALTVMIPNSVGPGKLLLKYGTEEQKNHWLPRLARGEEIPCFALTGPEAGSDAGAIPDTGVVCYGEYGGQRNVLGVRLNFEKRYITLAPVATVLGLAFRLYDPDRLLGERTDLGITLALVPAATPGIVQGRRHKPLHMAFLNGPLQGRDVFVPLDCLIGGPAYAGKGWRMLMECLTDGRSISLPALSTAAAKVCTRLAGAYARVRSQFKTPIGLFEGVEEALARIAGNTYVMDAARRVTLAALDAGHKPSVISGIVKYNLTARCRQVVDDAMDVHGGAALMLGPRNPLGQLHAFPEIGITVEGHNILTRNLIVFGQGAIRCHPFLLEELNAAGEKDEARALERFDAALLGHVGFAVSNAVRAFVMGLTGARFVRAPAVHREIRRHYRDLTRMSAAFALATDALLLTYRGAIKRRERISARMADVLSQLYLASTVLKRFHDQGEPVEDLPLVHWACEDALFTIQKSFDALFRNIEPRLLAWCLRALLFPLGRSYRAPGDALDRRVARLILTPGAARDRLISDMYFPRDSGDRFVVLEEAFVRLTASESLERRLKEAVREGRVRGRTFDELVEAARKAGVFAPAECEALRAAEMARREALKVDDFPYTGTMTATVSRELRRG
ncbi:MAG TPA: acyl-CoA dehydrogenase [Gammaproteobacteria bacterium]|nr:acyl-CoA dehydrogenase [Gammaproteobacteria bacterium]